MGKSSIRPYRKYNVKEAEKMTDGAARVFLGELLDNRYPAHYARLVAVKLCALIEENKEELEEKAAGELYQP